METIIFSLTIENYDALVQAHGEILGFNEFTFSLENDLGKIKYILLTDTMVINILLIIIHRQMHLILVSSYMKNCQMEF